MPQPPSCRSAPDCTFWQAFLSSRYPCWLSLFHASYTLCCGYVPQRGKQQQDGKCFALARSSTKHVSEAGQGSEAYQSAALQRRACKDATSVLPLRKIISNKRSGKSGSLSSAEVTSASDDFGTPETVQVKLHRCA